MLKIETIVCPTDLSDASLEAIPLATRMARLHGADLHLLHIHLLHSITPSEEDVPFPGEEEARAELETSAGEIEWSRVEHEIRRGVNAAPTILEYAEEHDADMIVMGSHGRRGFRRLLLGSVTEEVVRLAPFPVLVVRNRPEKPAPREVDRVIVPVDFSVSASAVIETARELASALDVPLELLHAVEPIPYAQMSYPIAIDHDDFRTHAQQRLQSYADDVEHAPGVTARTVIGMADQVIIEAVERSAAPLVVMSSHGHSGLARVLLGSTAERLLRHAPCPVMIVKDRDEEAG
ncbi:MAG: universal stress protein [Gemmatimonadota bacterium]